jgi:hypothetical protein
MKQSQLLIFVLLATIPFASILAQDRDDRSRREWRVEADDQVHTGRASVVRRYGDRLRIHLVNQDAMNFAVVLDGANQVTGATFSLDRGPTCSLVVSDPPFSMALDESAEGWLSGTFTGMLACPDGSALPIDGTFQVPDVKEEQ